MHGIYRCYLFRSPSFLIPLVVGGSTMIEIQACGYTGWQGCFITIKKAGVCGLFFGYFWF